MRIRTLLAGLATLTLWGTLWGCGGGGGAPASTGNPLANGRAALNRVASGTQTADTPTLQSILALYQQALQQDPNSAEAHFGIAVCLAGQVGLGVDGSGASGGGTGSVGSGTVTSNAVSKSARIVSRTREAAPTPPAPPNGGGGSNPGTLPPSPIDGDVPPAPPGHTLPDHPIPPPHTLGLIWNLNGSLSNPYTLLHLLSPVGDLREGLVPFYGYPQDTNSVAGRQKLLSDLGVVLQHLQAVEANPNFSTTLPDPYQNGKMVPVGLPEVYLFDAYVNSLRAEIALSLAYNRDPGNFNLLAPPIPVNASSDMPPAPPVFAAKGRDVGIVVGPDPFPLPSPYAALDKNKDGKLTPDEYLPPSPYLTLRDASLLQTAQQSMLAIVDKEQKGIDGVFARSADAIFLVPNSTDVHAILMEIHDHVLPLIQQAATGPVTLEIPQYQPVPLVAVSQSGGNTSNLPVASRPTTNGSLFALRPEPSPGVDLPPAPPTFTTVKITIDVAAWFSKPPADLKVFAPTYTLDVNGFLDNSKTTYPDPTFGGLYPNGVPSGILF